MTDYALFLAGLVLTTAAVGLFRILRGPAKIDRLMAVQLLGSGGVAILLLLAFATDTPSIVDVGLTLALLAAFLSAAFATSVATPPEKVEGPAP